MALRGDLPRVMARTRGLNTPVVAQMVGSVLTILAILANSSRSTANLYTFIILLSTTGVIILYLVGALAAWKLTTRPGPRIVVALALLFAVYALYGTGVEADLWCLVLLAAGLAVRAISRWRADSILPAEAIPVAPPESSS
jgi:APA family basic amino acid/polyamine antiporter